MQNQEEARLFPGLGGIPFRLMPGETVPMIKDSDPQRLRPTEVREGHAKIFDLSDPKQLAEYEGVIDKVAKGWALLSREEIQWDASKMRYMAFLRWVEVYLEQPKRGKCDADGNRVLR